MKFIFREAVKEGDKILSPTVSWNYGNFIQTVTDFIIIGVSLFFVIKIINQLRRKNDEEPTPETKPAPTAQESLLMEIRDIKKRDSKRFIGKQYCELFYETLLVLHFCNVFPKTNGHHLL